MNDRYDALDTTNKLIWNLRDIGNTMQHLYEGKGSQKRILILVDQAGSITQKELIRMMGIKSGTANAAIRKLELAGLLARTPIETDRRTYNIILTGAGRAAAEWTRGKRKQRHDQMFASLSREESEMLLRLLERVNADWDDKFRGSNADRDAVDYRKIAEKIG